MSALKRMIGILFVVSWCASAPASAARDPACSESVSLAALIADPDVYHGRTLWVVAHVTIEFENMTACPSGNGTDAKHCLWVDIDDGPYRSDTDYARYQSKLLAWEPFNLQDVAIHATFDKTLKGHLGMFPGGLRSITEVSAHQGGWRFTSSVAVPRTACAGELPAPEASGERWSRIGHLKLRNGDYDGAIDALGRALELEPGASRLYLLRGNAKKQKHDHAGAIADYTLAIEFEHDYKDVMFAARAVAREQSGDLDGAIADYTRAIDMDPAFDGNYVSRGLVKQKLGDAEGAAADLARARALAR
jgi:tetratricopeptide (TPR) repeat protein